MIIAVMSDSHDNIWNLKKALAIVAREKADMIVHCGDFVAPFMLKELNELNIPVHGVFGNNDGDRHLLTRLSLTELTNINLYGEIGELTLDGFTVGFVHLEQFGEGLAAMGKYKMVCCGHTHRYLNKTVGRTSLLNPGEIMGKDGSPGFCLVDIETLSIRRMSI